MTNTQTNSTEDSAALEASPVTDKSRVVDSAVDPVFGEIRADGPNYCNMGWPGATVLMCKTQIGIGAFAIPKSFDTLGLLPGIIALTFFSIVTTWSGQIIGKFRKNHSEVFGVEDVGKLLFGRTGKEFLHIAYMLYYIFVSASAFISVTTGLDVLVEYKACTAALIAAAAVLGLGFSSIETLSKIAWVAWLGMVGILISLFTLTIGVAVQDRPANAPQAGPWTCNWKVIGDPNFSDAMQALSSLIFSYSGTAAYFPIAAEMNIRKDYFKAMYICQSLVFMVYLIIGTVVYVYCGSYVAALALGSAGPMLARICYGIALSGLVVTEMIVLHLPAKCVFVRLTRNGPHLASRTKIHWAIWLSCTLSITLVAYVIASSIPGFYSMASLIGALFGTIISVTVYGMMWLHDNRNAKERSSWWIYSYCWACFIIVLGTLFMVAGTYGAILGIKEDFLTSKFTPWGCSNSLGK